MYRPPELQLLSALWKSVTSICNTHYRFGELFWAGGMAATSWNMLYEPCAGIDRVFMHALDNLLLVCTVTFFTTHAHPAKSPAGQCRKHSSTVQAEQHVDWGSYQRCKHTLCRRRLLVSCLSRSSPTQRDRRHISVLQTFIAAAWFQPHFLMMQYEKVRARESLLE